MPDLRATFKLLLVFLLFGFSLSAREREDWLREDVCFLSDSLNFTRRGGDCEGTLLYAERRLRDAGLRTRVTAFRTPEGRVGHNVEALLQGKGSKYIVVMAHADGLYTGDGLWYPGADANASGVAALLELARTLGSGTLQRNLLFVVLDGHHSSLSGASTLLSALRERGIGPSSVSMVINLDTVGSNLAPPSKGWKSYLIALGGSRWQEAIESCNDGLSLRLYYDYYDSRAFTDMFYRRVGDQAPFVEAGYRCVMFTSGITFNTNKRTDLPETLNYGLLARRVELIARWIHKI